jgi:hypothetical protein
VPGATDPDELLRALRQGAGDPPLQPLTLTPPERSARRGPAGAAVSWMRGQVLRLIAPSLAELIGQLERDRHRTRAELARLEARVAEVERRPPTRD